MSAGNLKCVKCRTTEYYAIDDKCVKALNADSNCAIVKNDNLCDICAKGFFLK